MKAKIAEEGDHDRLVDGAADALGAAGGGHALVTADDRDDRAEQRRLDDRAPQVGRRGVVEEGRPERAERRVVDERREHAAEDAEQQRVDVEQPGDQHQRQEARHDEVLDRVDAEHLERVELLADLAGAEVGGDRRAGDPASTIASTNGANSRIEASTKKPPRRSSAPNRTRKLAACRPGAS